MAAYNTTTKIFILDVDSDADSVTGSAAKTINDYWQTLDATTGQVQQMNTVPLGNGKIMVIIVHLG